MRISRAAIVVACSTLSLACSAGPVDDERALDSGPRPVDAGPIARECWQPLVVGERCDFARPCERIYDYWMGMCGSEIWSCDAGRLALTNQTYPCLDPYRSVPSCTDYEPPPAASETPCREDADCPTGRCWAPDAPSPYAACDLEDPSRCEADEDCADGELCRVGLDRCPRCSAPCAEGDGSCTRGEVCADDGRCRARRCDEGYECPRRRLCLSDTPGTDEHGCWPGRCDLDADCRCGACVHEQCARGPGLCEPDPGTG